MSIRITFALAASVLALAACQPETAKPAAEAPPAAAPATTAAADGCTAVAESAWKARKVEGRTFGPSCAEGVAVLTIRSADNKLLYSWSGRVQDLLGLKDVANVSGMKPALDEWISGSGGHSNTSELGAWEETDGQPKRAEFPFMPEDGIDKAGWEDLKKAKLDMFCFVQGGESMKCTVARDGGVEDVGLQLFPG